MSNEVNDFLFSGGAKSFQFENIGDVVRGTITAMEKRQQTSLEDGKPLFWDDGSPRMLAVFTLQTSLHDDDNDDGLRSIYAKGGRYEVAEGEGTSLKDAIAQAVRDAKATSVELGDELAVGFTGRAKAKRGQTPAKLYAASFRKGTKPVSADDLFGPEPSPLETGV